MAMADAKQRLDPEGRKHEEDDAGDGASVCEPTFALIDDSSFASAASVHQTMTPTTISFNSLRPSVLDRFCSAPAINNPSKSWVQLLLKPWCLKLTAGLLTFAIQCLTYRQQFGVFAVLSLVYVWLVVDFCSQLPRPITFGWLLTTTCLVIVVAWFLLDDKWTRIDVVVLPLSLAAILFFGVCVSDCSTPGEKFMVTTFLSGIVAVSVVINITSDHPCTMCALEVPGAFGDYVLPILGYAPTAKMGNNPVRQLPQAWQLLLGHGGPFDGKCANCINFLTGLTEQQHESTSPSEGEEDKTTMVNKDNCPTIDLKSTFSSEDLRWLDMWYEDVQQNDTVSFRYAGKRFIEALAAGVSTEEGKQKLAEAVHGFACSPASRVGPPPSDFLIRLQKPRFTGESADGSPMNITSSAILDIFAGTKIRELGPAVCFLVRMANNIPENTLVETDTINPSMIAPIVTEKELKGEVVSFLVPPLYIPRTDEDKDPDGSVGDMVEALLSLFVKLPMKDKATIYFDSKEEYIGFFRWNIEHVLQGEFYFPKWIGESTEASLLKDASGRGMVEMKNMVREMGDLISKQFQYNNDRLVLSDPTSDETLSDRAFFGTGASHLRRIKLPWEPDYFYPMNGPESFESEDHRQFFKVKEMPTERQLVEMGDAFWKQHPFYESFVGVRRVKKNVSLADYPMRVVQIDYMVLSRWQHRDAFQKLGSILYLDAVTRKPMGLYVAFEKRIVLPNEGHLWAYAKLLHRSTEITWAAFRHVGQFHIGIANTFHVAIRQTLPQTHPLRAFLKPYTHGTGTVNWNALQMLLRDQSILHRASGFERRARGHSLGYIFRSLNFTRTFPEALEEKKLGGISNLTKDMPLFAHGTKLFAIHHEFVQNYVDLIYPNDEILFSDNDLYRFWNHINTLGRHTDPCVCLMDENRFWAPHVWPSFEENRNCEALMDHSNFFIEQEDKVERRRRWCERHPIGRTRLLHTWIQSDCEKDPNCPALSYEFEHMRNNMGLPELSRAMLIKVLSQFIFEVTAGHELVSDNLPYLTDPGNAGARLERKDPNNSKLYVDFSTFVYGTVIAALTTIRSMPLLGDWSQVLVHWIEAFKVKELSNEQRAQLRRRVQKLHLRYKAQLVHFSKKLIQESAKTPENRWAPFLNPATQAGSIAV